MPSLALNPPDSRFVANSAESCGKRLNWKPVLHANAAAGCEGDARLAVKEGCGPVAKIKCPCVNDLTKSCR